MLKSCFFQSANHMNSSLLSLYRKGNSDSVSSTPEMEQRETTVSTPRTTSKTDPIPLKKTPARASEGGWFIDKTPGGKKDSFFSDLADEKNNHKKPISEIEVFL